MRTRLVPWHTICSQVYWLFTGYSYSEARWIWYYRLRFGAGTVFFDCKGSWKVLLTTTTLLSHSIFFVIICLFFISIAIFSTVQCAMPGWMECMTRAPCMDWAAPWKSWRRCNGAAKCYATKACALSSRRLLPWRRIMWVAWHYHELSILYRHIFYCYYFLFAWIWVVGKYSARPSSAWVQCSIPRCIPANTRFSAARCGRPQVPRETPLKALKAEGNPGWSLWQARPCRLIHSGLGLFAAPGHCTRD